LSPRHPGEDVLLGEAGDPRPFSLKMTVRGSVNLLVPSLAPSSFPHSFFFFFSLPLFLLLYLKRPTFPASPLHTEDRHTRQSSSLPFEFPFSSCLIKLLPRPSLPFLFFVPPRTFSLFYIFLSLPPLLCVVFRAPSPSMSPYCRGREVSVFLYFPLCLFLDHSLFGGLPGR